LTFKVKRLIFSAAFSKLAGMKLRLILLVFLILDHFNRTLENEVCYLMDPRGDTIASSNRLAADSFVGENFDFRPYFQLAVQGQPATYLALGTTSGRRGAYYSHPIVVEGRPAPVGVVVIKASVEPIERQWVSVNNEIVLVTDPNGVVFISNRREWLYHSVHEREDRFDPWRFPSM